MTTEIERVPVPDHIEPSPIKEEPAHQIERANYERSRELIAAGERERVERALALAREHPNEIARMRAQWAWDNDGKWSPPTMPADLLADWRAELGRLPHQMRGIERALGEREER